LSGISGKLRACKGQLANHPRGHSIALGSEIPGLQIFDALGRGAYCTLLKLLESSYRRNRVCLQANGAANRFCGQGLVLMLVRGRQPLECRLRYPAIAPDVFSCGAMRRARRKAPTVHSYAAGGAVRTYQPLQLYSELPLGSILAHVF